MRYLKSHAKEGSKPLAIAGEIAEHSLDNQESKDDIDGDEKEIIDLYPLEPRSIKSLNEKY
jgi:hypothetical protein